MSHPDRPRPPPTANLSWDSVSYSNCALDDSDAEALDTSRALRAAVDVSFDTVSGIGRLLPFLVRALQWSRRLKRLTIFRCGIDDEGAAVLAAALTTNTCLTSLCLSSNLIGVDGVGALCTALVSNTTLKSLNVCDNYLTDTCADVLSTMLRTNTSLTALYVTSAYSKCRHRVSPTVWWLFPSDVGFSLGGVRAITDALRVNRTLELIALAQCPRPNGAATVRAVIDALRVNTSLSTVYIGKGHKLIRHALWRNERLRMCRDATTLLYMKALCCAGRATPETDDLVARLISSPTWLWWSVMTYLVGTSCMFRGLAPY